MSTFSVSVHNHSIHMVTWEMAWTYLYVEAVMRHGQEVDPNIRDGRHKIQHYVKHNKAQMFPFECNFF